MLMIIPNSEDISSFSNFNEIIQKEVYIDVSINFSESQIFGIIEVNYEIISSDIKNLILDLKGPEISSIEYILKKDEEIKSIPVNFTIDKENKYKNSLGTPLIIPFNQFEKNEDFKKSLKEKKLIFRYKFITKGEKCAGIQFLTKEQTTTKEYPFMFTQCEAIQCRSLFPIQDSPSVKSIYKVKTSIESPLTFLFGGLIKKKDYDELTKKNIILFEQPIPIPSYLVSFVAGELEYGKISERCGVWTEKGLNKLACKEFINAEKYVQIAENYFDHKYEWEVYNLLVLPFSFPYGGMENPNLTFVTPALLAGDGSMSNVIGHEISHSWTGNLVTNSDWKNFWVNEGFTIFMERKLDEELFGEDMANLEAIVGNNELIADIKLLDDEFTCLAPNYEGIDPDDGFSTVPYEKGYQFLIFMENLVGKDHFRNIMRIYIKEFRYKSVDYKAFKGVFEKYVNEKFDKNKAKNIIDNINWEKWLYEKGIPSYKNNFVSKLAEDAIKLAEDFLKGVENKDEALKIFKEWHTNVKLHFMNYLLEKKDNFDIEFVKKLKNELNLAECYNAEIKYMWYLLALDKNLEEEIPNVKKFLESIGRLKYIRPVYFAWMDKNFEQAKEFFDKNKNIYHPYARRMIQDKFNSKLNPEKKA